MANKKDNSIPKTSTYRIVKCYTVEEQTVVPREYHQRKEKRILY